MTKQMSSALKVPTYPHLNTSQKYAAATSNNLSLGLIDIYDPAYHAFLGFESVRDCTIKPKDPNVAKPKMDCCGEYPDRQRVWIFSLPETGKKTGNEAEIKMKNFKLAQDVLIIRIMITTMFAAMEK